MQRLGHWRCREHEIGTAGVRGGPAVTTILEGKAKVTPRGKTGVL